MTFFRVKGVSKSSRSARSWDSERTVSSSPAAMEAEYRKSGFSAVPSIFTDREDGDEITWTEVAFSTTRVSLTWANDAIGNKATAMAIILFIFSVLSIGKNGFQIRQGRIPGHIHERNLVSVPLSGRLEAKILASVHPGVVSRGTDLGLETENGIA